MSFAKCRSFCIGLNGLIQPCCQQIEKHTSAKSLHAINEISRQVYESMNSIGCIKIAHDSVIKWEHFPRYWPFVRGIHRHRWISLTKASDAERWCFRWSAPEQMVEQTIETLVIWDAIVPIMTVMVVSPKFVLNLQGEHRTISFAFNFSVSGFIICKFCPQLGSHAAVLFTVCKRRSNKREENIN